MNRLLIYILFLIFVLVPHDAVKAYGPLVLPFTDTIYPISQDYNDHHHGIDFDTPDDPTPPVDIVAALDGKVVTWVDGWDNDPACYCYGNYIKIDHGNGLMTLYAHLKKYTLSSKVENYKNVVQGEFLAKENNSGYSTGDHLHFEVWQNGVRVNPYSSANYLWTHNPPKLASEISKTPQWLHPDFNDDGLSDLLFYNPETGAAELKLAAGNNQFTTLWKTTWSAGWRHYFGDFNGDGVSDHLFYRPTDGRVLMRLNNGSGYFNTTVMNGTWSANWQVVPGDFNGDGVDEFFLYHNDRGHIYMATSTGNGGFRWVWTLRDYWSLGWKITPGDWNSDGRTDLNLYRPYSGLTHQYTTREDQYFTFHWTATWSQGWQIIPANLNNDLATDILFYRPSDGIATAYLANNTADATLTIANPSYWPRTWSTNWQITTINPNQAQDQILFYRSTDGRFAFYGLNQDISPYYINSDSWSSQWNINQ